MTQNPRLIDLTGHRFGRLTVVMKAGNTAKGAAVWKCRCDCGNTSQPTGSDLRKGKVKSCGCARREAAHRSLTTHGATGSRLYRIWKSMKGRCHAPSANRNKYYGGKGIQVCPEWRNSFEMFRSWALTNGYRDDLTIERIDSDANYGPENCKWATRKQQSKNRDYAKKNGDGQLWSEVARENGITLSAFRTRIYDGWPQELAATWPMFKKRPNPHRH